MIQLKLTKTERNGRFVYRILNANDEVLYKSAPTHRTYVAITLRKRGGAFEVLNRFGRADLLGKGESKHYWGRPDIFLASIIDHTPKSVVNNPNHCLKLGDVIDFLVGIQIDKVEQRIAKEISQHAADHAIRKLRGYCDEATYITIEAVGMWLTSLDLKHRAVIERYIIENHKPPRS